MVRLVMGLSCQFGWLCLPWQGIASEDLPSADRGRQTGEIQVEHIKDGHQRIL